MEYIRYTTVQYYIIGRYISLTVLHTFFCSQTTDLASGVNRWERISNTFGIIYNILSHICLMLILHPVKVKDDQNNGILYMVRYL